MSLVKSFWQQYYRSTNVPVNGVINIGNTCFLSVILQALASLPTFQSFLRCVDELPRELEPGLEYSEPMKVRDEIIHTLHKYLRDLTPEKLAKNANPVNPYEFTRIPTLNDKFMQSREQQDAQEFFNVLMEILNAELFVTKAKHRLRNLHKFRFISARKHSVGNFFSTYSPSPTSHQICLPPSSLNPELDTSTDSSASANDSHSNSPASTASVSPLPSPKRSPKSSNSEFAAKKLKAPPAENGHNGHNGHIIHGLDDCVLYGQEHPHVVSDNVIENGYHKQNAVHEKTENHALEGLVSILKCTTSTQHRNTDKEEFDINDDDLFNIPFSGKFKSTVKCLGCGEIREKYEEFMDVQLSIPSSGKYRRLSVYDCMDFFTKSETVHNVHCETCYQKTGEKDQSIEKSISISSLPSALCLSLKRLTGLYDKNDHYVSFPIEGLKLFRYISPELEFSNRELPSHMIARYGSLLFGDTATSGAFTGDIAYHKPHNALGLNKGLFGEATIDLRKFYSTYNLHAIIVHDGSGLSGHFSAYRKINSDWVFISDEFYRKVSVEEVKKASAYMLFYELVHPINCTGH